MRSITILSLLYSTKCFNANKFAICIYRSPCSKILPFLEHIDLIYLTLRGLDLLFTEDVNYFLISSKSLLPVNQFLRPN